MSRYMIREKVMQMREIIAPSVPVETISKDIAGIATSVLDELKAGETLTTTQLADEIWPIESMTPDDIGLKKRLFRFLLHTHSDNNKEIGSILPTYRTRGTPKRNKFGKTAWPWVWFNPAVTRSEDIGQVA